MTKAILSILALSLLFSGTVLPMTVQTDRVASHVRELLVQDAWLHDVRIGPMAVERYVLVFREAGKVSEMFFDDTGGYQASGSWQLEESGEQVILVISGEQLRNRGRFTITEVFKDKTIELQRVGDERAIRFERVKGHRPPESKDEG